MATIICNLNFGRFKWDRELAWDPRKHANPQIQITHNKASGGSAPDAGTMTVWAEIFEDAPPSPRGYLMTTEVYSYTPGSSGSYEYIDIPTDYPIRKLAVMSFYTLVNTFSAINEIRLSDNELKNILIDDKISNLQRTQMVMYGNYKERILVNIATSDTVIYCAPTMETYPVVTGVEDTDKVYGLTIDSYGGTITAEAETTAGECNVVLSGWAPHGATVIPFGRPNEIADWYAPRPAEKPVLRLKAGSSGSSTTAQVVLQQLRRY